MKIPFTAEQFYGVFEKYNTTIFPIPIIIFLLGFILLFTLHTKSKYKNKLIGSVLGIIWLWVGLVYHITFFTAINKAAFIFGALFIVQGLLIIINTFKGKLAFSFEFTKAHLIGYFFIIFGLFIYPLIGYFLDSSFIRTISLGLPCPTTIFTFGIFLLTNKNFSKHLLVIPSIWAIVGLSAAINFGVYQDYMMLIAAIFANIILIKRKYANEK